MKSVLRNFFIALIIFLTIVGILGTQRLPQEVEKISMDKMVGLIDEDSLSKILIEGNTLELTLKSGEKRRVIKEAADSFSTLMKNYSVNPERLRKIQIDVQQESKFYVWFSAILPFLLPLLIIGGFLYFTMRQVQGANTRALMFGQVRPRESLKGKERITFDDVAGVEEAKDGLKEVVEFLKNQKKFIALGAKIPKGVLLMGSPGTGKTLLAKAVAGEAEVPFFSISGSEFVEMFVGVGAARVRDLFRKAKSHAPCIIFVDELDAVGRQRGAGLGGSHDEREQTLNQILVEMDGFDPNLGIIVLAATNRPDVLDPALLRPGRFDRRIILDEPDLKDREAILKIHSRNKPLDKNVSLRKIAEHTPGFSGADLANLLNEAAILAARRGKLEINEEAVLISIEKVMLGPERRSHILNEHERKITAYHESGHALVSRSIPGADSVRKISIIARGPAAGYTLKLPSEDKYLRSSSEFKAELAAFVAGHVVEKEVFDDITTGAANDLREATRIAKKMVTEFGMSETLGPRTFGQKEELVFLGRDIREQRDFSEEVAQQIDREVSKLIHNAVTTARRIVREKRKTLDKIVEILLKQETIEQEEFEKLCAAA